MIRLPNVFLLGRPGCGKSAAYWILEKQLRDWGYDGELERIDDFPLLQQTLEEDEDYERHRPAEGGGVKITDDSVWDDLARGLDEKARRLQGEDRLLFIEFARKSYVRAFENFSPEVLENSIVLYIDCPFEICWERNVKRWEEEEGIDAHLVSKEEMKETYAEDDHEKLPEHLDIPVITIKNDYSGLDKLEERLQKVPDRVNYSHLTRFAR